MRNILKNICIKTGQSVGYWIRTGQKKVCLYRVNSKSELNHHLTEGSVYPLVAGSGKILLAYSENKTKLIKEIEKKGYIHTAEERVKNIASVAIPIFNSENQASEINTYDQDDLNELYFNRDVTDTRGNKQSVLEVILKGIGNSNLKK